MNDPALNTPSAAPSLAKLTALVADDLAKVNQTIIQYVKSDVALIEQLATHLIAAGGKRLRPSLTLATSQLLGYEGDRHIMLAACIEFIHSATLLHDDVVDASELRRGEATANALWGNEASVLVGDFLLSRAFQMMVDDGSIDVLRTLADASATIAAGEVKQLSLKGRIDAPMQDYFDVIQAKTATLFAAACELSAIAAGKNEDRENMRQFGMSLGMAFQLIDDALDYSGDASTLGKTIGDDLREGKATYPLLMAYQRANDDDKKFLQQVFEFSDKNTTDILIRIQEIFAKTQAISATVDCASGYLSKAKKAVDIYSDCYAKTALLDTLDFCVSRSA
jgi:octaprenyl-diphosphate synthase